jgi:uncharacterized protein YecE (DUF72 family)
MAPPHLFAGTSGWAYPTWKPGFYPAKLPASQFLRFYASQLNSVEVNYTFRTLPPAPMLQGWLDQTTPAFRFSFKAPQRITHFSRLRNCDQAVADLLAALHPAALAGKLGLILFQLPPNFQVDEERLRTFLKVSALRDPAAPRIAFEFRHQSWFSDQVYAILREHDAALCIAQTDDLDTPEVHTATRHTCFRLRRHGGYSAGELSAFASRFTQLAESRDVYVYFRHEDEPTGALNATSFRATAAAAEPAP